MKYHVLIAGILVILLLAAGCTDESGSDTGTPVPVTPAGAKYGAGDIVGTTSTQAEPLWLILKYDRTTDKYERALVYKKADRSWGERRDSKSDMFPRGDMEKLYPVKVTHVTVSSVAVKTPTVPVTSATIVPPGPVPEITSITPNSGASGSTVTITNLAGRNFVSGATVKLTGPGLSPIIASQVQAIDTKITCILNLNGAAAGKRDVVVTNPDGRSATLVNGFMVNEAAPVITGISPAEGTAGETPALLISGNNFKTPAKVLFVRGSTELEAANVEVKSATQISCVLGIPSNTQTGEYDIIVRNVIDKQNGTLLKKFTINNAT